MNITFVNAFFKTSSHLIPIGIEILATMINAQTINHKATVLDLNDNLELTTDFTTYIDARIVKILSTNPDVVSLYTLANSLHISLEIAKKIKEVSPEIIIILAGPQATLIGEPIMHICSAIDIIAYGEGEGYILQLMESIHKENLDTCPYITYRQGDTLINNKKNLPLLDNLDKLPFIKHQIISKEAPPKSIPIEVGRGCPFNCTYCATKTFWCRRFRMKSVERIINEIKYYITEYNIYHFSFVHDLFTYNKKTVIDICNTIINDELNITWDCSSRLDTLDKEQLDIMAKSGCTGIYIGIETGSQRMQHIVKKNLNLTHIENSFDLLKSYDMSFFFSFIYGFPQENIEDLEETLYYIRLLKESYSFEIIQLHRCSLLPGTELYANYKDSLYMNSQISSALECNYIVDNRKLIETYPSIFSSFYSTVDNITDKYPNLDIFINFLYSTMAEYLPVYTKKIFGDIDYNKHASNILVIYDLFKPKMQELIDLTVQVDLKEDSGIYTTKVLDLCHVFMSRLPLNEQSLYTIEYRIAIESL